MSTVLIGLTERPSAVTEFEPVPDALLDLVLDAPDRVGGEGGTLSAKLEEKL